MTKLVRLALVFVVTAALLFGGAYAIFRYFEGHAIHVLAQSGSPDTQLMVVGKSDGAFSGWKMQLCYKKDGSWAIYSLSRESKYWVNVSVTESNGHALVFVSDKLVADLNLSSLLLDNKLQHLSGNAPISLINDQNPFNKSAVINPGGAGWPSKWPTSTPMH